MEQVFNFKLTRLGACAVGSLIGKTNGWPGSQAGEQEQVEGGRSKMGVGRKLPMWEKGAPCSGDLFALCKPELLASPPTAQRDVYSLRCSP